MLQPCQFGTPLTKPCQLETKLRDRVSDIAYQSLANVSELRRRVQEKLESGSRNDAIQAIRDYLPAARALSRQEDLNAALPSRLFEFL